MSSGGNGGDGGFTPEDRHFLAQRQHQSTRARFMAKAAAAGVDDFSLNGGPMANDGSGNGNPGGMSDADIYGTGEPTQLRPGQYANDPVEQPQPQANTPQGRQNPYVRPQPNGNPDKRYIEIEIDGYDTEVGLIRRNPDGTQGVITVTIKPMTMDRINMLGWHQERVNSLQNQLLRITDPGQAERLAARVDAAQEKLVRYMIPDFPINTFGGIPASAFKRLTDLIQQMSEEALNTDDDDAPND